jgi:peptide/nickel transport system permease protein
MRNRLLEEKSQMWTTVLAAKGMNDLSIFSRLIKVSLPTVLTVVGIQMSVVLAGTMITEIIFDIPGIGSLLFESIQNRDYPLVQGIIAYSTIVYMVVYFFIDFANEKIDPRIGRTS